MYTTDDFFTFIEYLRKTIDGESTSSIDLTTSETSRLLNERDIASSLFSKTMDLTAFSTNDWRRIRRMVIDWYASFRNIITTSKELKDVRSMSSDDIQELFESFGFTTSTTEMLSSSRISFFLDLINLYKIKGTPLSIKTALEYFALTGTYDVSEYWVDINNAGNVVFRPVSVFENLDAPWRTLPHDEMTSDDSHWRMSESQILQLHNTNKLHLPSKSPYFLASPYYNLTDLTGVISILVREVNDQYQIWVDSGELSTTLDSFTQNTVGTYGSYSLLETYMGALYCMEKYYDNNPLDSTGSYRIHLYDSPAELDTSLALNNYNSLIKTRVNSPTDFTNIASQISSDYEYVVGGLNPYFLIDLESDVGDMLNRLNSSIKTIIDDVFTNEENWEVTFAFFNILDLHIQRYDLSRNLPDLTGTLFRNNISAETWNEIINFFKPYKSRIAFQSDAVYVIDDPRDVFPVETYNAKTERINDYVDFFLGDSISCTFGPSSYPITPRSTYDCGSYHDIGSFVERDFQITQTS